MWLCICLTRVWILEYINCQKSLFLWQNAWHTALSWINFGGLLAQFLHDINPSYTLLIFPIFLTLAFKTFWFPRHQPKYSFFLKIFLLSSFLVSSCFSPCAECSFLSCLNFSIALLQAICESSHQICILKWHLRMFIYIPRVNLSFRIYIKHLCCFLRFKPKNRMYI